ncbi:MAG: PorT family protein [Dysgonamonadaceae bacterium]|jgi:hypothetical protein|nr:PorT family protein [Dysgonamonadaceae bacterium]
MRRLSFFVFLAILNISYLCAQRNRFQNELYVGFGGGAQMSQVDFMPKITQDYRLGFQGGVAVKYISDGNAGVRAGVIGELNFSQRGWVEKFNDEQTELGFSYSRALNYVSIPFMTHVNAGRGNVRFIFNAGPQVSFLLSDSQNMSQTLADDIAKQQAADPNNPTIGVQYQPFDHLKRIDYGLIGGVGMQLRTGVGDFDLEGRYNFGLADVFESRRSRSAHFSRSAHRVIEVKLTYYRRIF